MVQSKYPLIVTEKDKCKVCYTCVRECPAKAIKITKGQAEIVEERCIGCGNCVVVCSQNAKKIRDSKESLNKLLNESNKVIAMIAPSFPAEFIEIDDYRKLVTMVRKLGFDKVVEVSFGADIIALDYFKAKKNTENEYFISSTCPAIVKFIEKYHPDIVKYLSTTVSPMIAMSRVVKKEYGLDTKIVFFGPCLAKKDEAELFIDSKIDAVLTFRELREIFEDKNIVPSSEKSDFDPPIGGKGSILPITGGLLQTVEAYEDIPNDNVIVAEGKNDFPEAIKEFESGILCGNHLDLLCCNGCIMGAGMSKDGKRFERMAKVSAYVKEKLLMNQKEHAEYIDKYKNIDLIRTFKADDQRILIEKDEAKIKSILFTMGKVKTEDELNCSACGYETCRKHAIAILKGLAESEMCLPYTIEQMHNYINILGETNVKLADAKDALKKSEKLATMGQLAAGIAHEVNNPLGVVLMYSHLLMEEIDVKSELHSDLKMIASQADRCKNILSGLLNFARKNELKLKSVKISDLFETVIQSVVVPKSVTITNNHKEPDRQIYLDPDQIVQVFSNLIKNSIEAMNSKGSIVVGSRFTTDEIIFTIEDDGQGIPKENIDKLFEPFFTTKEMGKGTGLGLAVCYGIIKMHRGKILIDSNTDVSLGKTGAKFTIKLPLRKL
ncbi:MAG: ATP-binding protein [Candidatus Delongbacteria bacterium]|jgi:two-component system NtrC family sensor kinase|nr:ATP-binding protein [Candidatus Delongbacteria bacterium]